MHVPLLDRLPIDRTLWIASTALAMVVGLLGGSIMSLALNASAYAPQIVRGSGAAIVSVVLEGFRDGALHGTAAGPVRLFAQDETVEIDEDGAFAIVHAGFRIEDVTVPIPPGMHFVASKKGKKLYSVTSAAGERIAPQNRVYFETEAAAQAAGFVR